jgi:benzodiazapine receptor
MRTVLLTSAASAATALVGGLGTDPESTWYRALAKPRWYPPDIAFPLVWTPLYGLIAYGTARAIDAERNPVARRRLWALVGADLTVNAGWCWAFFRAERPVSGVVVIAVLDGLNVALLSEAARRDRRAAAVLAPYVVWSLFATALNTDIWLRNRWAPAGQGGGSPR